MFNEVASQREQMYESIGRYVNVTENMTFGTSMTIRRKRGLVNIVGSAMKILFGVCIDDCAKETNGQIEKIDTINVNMLYIIKIRL